MRILVDHLTRMAAGYICVAGVDDRGCHIRPVLGTRIPANHLKERGGVFAIGAIVDIGHTTPTGQSPEVEDHAFDLVRASHVADDTDRMWTHLMADAELSLVDIFGHELTKTRRSAYVPPGAGRASLGTFEPGYRPKVFIDSYGKIRCEIVDPGLGELNLSVTDVRLYNGDAWASNGSAVQRIATRIERGETVRLSVGLGRAHTISSFGITGHWLQVNNVHFGESAQPQQESTPSFQDRIDAIRREYPNAYNAWTETEEQELRDLHAQDAGIREMCDRLGRQPGGIRSRLKRLELD